ncbi:MAG: hypothetical protein MK202_13620 [Tenacibaculum sp.]|nr:hypothetical protein [Tenacibaculum sp.]
MKKAIFKLGKKLTKNEQRVINGGYDDYCKDVPDGSWCIKDDLMGYCKHGKCDLFAVGGGNEDSGETDLPAIMR